jgi:medium-chain acyl-[acyl-carrier-protein] hydrolase
MARPMAVGSEPQSSPWLWRSAGKPASRSRLFCFPFAGASAALYRDWRTVLCADVEVCPVELPGRARRLREPIPGRFEALVEAAAEGLLPFLDRPFAMFGYSLGALIAFELARQLRRLGVPGPTHLLLAARAAPQLPPDPIRPRHDLPQSELIARLEARYGSRLDPDILANPAMLEIVIGAIRGDLRLLDSYHYRPEVPLSCPITVFGGQRDRSVPPEALMPWAEQTAAGFQVRILDGEGHFFSTSAVLTGQVDQLLRRSLES